MKDFINIPGLTVVDVAEAISNMKNNDCPVCGCKAEDKMFAPFCCQSCIDEYKGNK